MGTALAAQPDDLTSIPRTHAVKTEPVPSDCLLTVTWLTSHTRIINNKKQTSESTCLNCMLNLASL
ncbi:hypothetical protein LEMLEM_LOCUS8517 [Lemmus lemmus]